MSNVPRMLLLMLVMSATGAEALAQERPDRRERAEVSARRGWLGLVYSPVEGRGWMAIRGIAQRSPAARAGLSAGDTIISWNGQSNPLRAALEDPPRPGETVRLQVRRGPERRRDVSVVVGSEPEIRLQLDSLAVHADSLHTRLRVMLRDSLGPVMRRLEETEMPRIQAEIERAQREVLRELPRIRAEAERVEREMAREMSREMSRVTVAGGFALGRRSVAGAEFAELNEGLADYFGTDEGVLVLRVAPDTPAARSGLRAGDVVVSARGRAVKNVQEVREAVLESRDREVELVIVRRGARQGLRLRWE